MTFFSPFPPKPLCTFFNPKILHDHCFQILLGITVDPIEMEDNGQVFFGGEGGGGE